MQNTQNTNVNHSFEMRDHMYYPNNIPNPIQQFDNLPYMVSMLDVKLNGLEKTSNLKSDILKNDMCLIQKQLDLVSRDINTILSNQQQILSKFNEIPLNNQNNNNNYYRKRRCPNHRKRNNDRYHDNDRDHNSKYEGRFNHQDEEHYNPVEGQSINDAQENKNAIAPELSFPSGGIVIQVDEPLESGGGNQLVDIFQQMLFGQKKEEVVEEDTESEESDTESEDDVDYDELEKPIENISDLIELGHQCLEAQSKPTIDKKPKKVKYRNKIYIEEVIKEIPEEEIKEQKGAIIDDKHYNIDSQKLIDLIVPLEKLQDMIGLAEVKDKVLDMIFFYLQRLEKKSNMMLHTTIEGPPGVGKTEVGKILAEVYAAMGVLPENKITFAKRSDFIGKYVGHTEDKTEEFLNDAEGGVLFIDEAYSLGGGSKGDGDNFSKVLMNMLTTRLTEKKRKLIVIIAGYEEELGSEFFSANKGLERRFPPQFRFKIKGYSAIELRDIFLKMLDDANWKLCQDPKLDGEENEAKEDNVEEDKGKKKKKKKKETNIEKLTNFFENNEDKFNYFGGDIENLFTSCKFSHSRRIFGKNMKDKKKLTMGDIKDGLQNFIKNKKDINTPPMHMYS
jgi:hypothetical protein